MALTMVTPDVKRGQLAIFVDYLKAKYGLSDISEMDLRPYNVRLLYHRLDLPKREGELYSFLCLLVIVNSRFLCHLGHKICNL